jgi:hypothetical protein
MSASRTCHQKLSLATRIDRVIFRWLFRNRFLRPLADRAAREKILSPDNLTKSAGGRL